MCITTPCSDTDHAVPRLLRYRYFYAEFMYYIIFLIVYTVTTWYKVWEESSEVVVELQVAATALAIPISLREAVEICNGGSCKGLLKLGKTNQNF